MKTYIEFLAESEDRKSNYLSKLPPRPGEASIPDGNVRLYHQTSEANLDSIAKNGIKITHRPGAEGPLGVWKSATGFYGKPDSLPTVEFSVPKDESDDSMGGPLFRDIKPEEIHAIHRPWHKTARYIIKHGHDTLSSINNGEFDDRIKNIDMNDSSVPDYIKAAKHIRDNY